MSQATITTEVHQSLDVAGHHTPQIPFNLTFSVYNVANLCRFRFSQIVGAGVRINTGLL
jgi:hypothetical protein